jgi:hypothetical protein
LRAGREERWGAELLQSVSLRLLLRQCFFGWPLIISGLPVFVGIEAVHALESFKRISPEILLVNDPVVADGSLLR